MPKPGVGYTVANPTSFYILGTLASPVQSHLMDLTALPAQRAEGQAPEGVRFVGQRITGGRYHG